MLPHKMLMVSDFVFCLLSLQPRSTCGIVLKLASVMVVYICADCSPLDMRDNSWSLSSLQKQGKNGVVFQFLLGFTACGVY